MSACNAFQQPLKSLISRRSLDEWGLHGGSDSLFLQLVVEVLCAVPQCGVVLCISVFLYDGFKLLPKGCKDRAYMK